MKTHKQAQSWCVSNASDRREYEFRTQAEQSAFLLGYAAALDDWGVWKDGERFIGCMPTNIRDAYTKVEKTRTSPSEQENA